MKSLIIASCLLITAALSAAPADVAKEFLAYAYGKEGVNIQELCLPHDDLWMLRGLPNPSGLKAVDGVEIKLKQSGVFIGVVGRDMAVVELKGGKVDATYNLEMIYGLQRRLILDFLYSSLLQDKEALARIVTVPANISFGKAPKAGYGDMDQYGEILGMLPVVRLSKSDSDKESRSITYRVPLAPEGLALRLVKQGNTWKIDTSTKLTVPLEFFSDRRAERDTS